LKREDIGITVFYMKFLNFEPWKLRQTAINYLEIDGFLPLIKSGEESFAGMAEECVWIPAFAGTACRGMHYSHSSPAIPAKAGIQNSKMTKNKP